MSKVRSIAAVLAIVLCGTVLLTHLRVAAATAQSAPLTPALDPVGAWPSDEQSPSIRRIARAGSTAYALDGQVVQVLDVSDPTRPTRRARVDLGVAGFSLAVAGTALLILQDSGVRIFDVANPSQPREVSSYPSPIGSCQSTGMAMGVAGQRAYLSFGPATTLYPCNRRFVVLDVAKPAAPVEIGALDGVGTSGAIRIVGSTAYLAESGLLNSRFSREYGTLRIVDLSDPTRPTAMGSLQSGMTILNGVGLIGRYAYLGGGNTCGGGFSCNDGARVEIVDVSSAAHPAQAATLVSGFTNDIETTGDLLFVAEARSVNLSNGYIGCLRLYDASESLAPRQVAATAALQQDNDVSLDDAYAYVADGDAVQIFRWVGSKPIPVPTRAAYRVLMPRILTPLVCEAGV